MTKQLFKNWTDDEIRAWAAHLPDLLKTSANSNFVKRFLNLIFQQQLALNLTDNEATLRVLVDLFKTYPELVTVLHRVLPDDSAIFHIEQDAEPALSDAWYEYTTKIAEKTGLVWAISSAGASKIVPTLKALLDGANQNKYFLVSKNWGHVAGGNLIVKNGDHPLINLPMGSMFLPLENKILVWTKATTKTAQVLTNLSHALPGSFVTLDEALSQGEDVSLKNPYSANLANPVLVNTLAADDLVVYRENAEWTDADLNVYLSLLDSQLTRYDKIFAKRLLRFVSDKASLELSRNNTVDYFKNVLIRFVLDKAVKEKWASVEAGRKLLDNLNAHHLKQIQKLENENLKAQVADALKLKADFLGSDVVLSELPANRALFLIQPQALLDYTQLYNPQEIGYFKLTNDSSVIKINTLKSVVLKNKQILTVLNATNKWEHKKILWLKQLANDSPHLVQELTGPINFSALAGLKTDGEKMSM